MIFVATGRPILDFEVSFLIFKGNYTTLANSSEPSAQLVAIEEDIHPKRVERRAINIATDVHNFYASVSMLVDHYRTNKSRGIYSGQFARELDEKKTQLFADNVLGTLSGKLRNHFAHASIPVIRLNRGMPNYQAVLDIAHLRNSLTAANQAERGYLASLKDQIPVRQLADEYFSRAEELYQWTQKRFAALNSAHAGDLKLLLEPLGP